MEFGVKACLCLRAGLKGGVEDGMAQDGVESSYGHIHGRAPEPVRSLKLSLCEPGKY